MINENPKKEEIRGMKDEEEEERKTELYQHKVDYQK